MAGATFLLLSTALAPTPRLVDAATLAVWTGAGLHLPALYIVLAPLCDLFDQLSLLSKDQHIAFLLTLVIVYIAWRLLPRRRAARGWLRRAAFETGLAFVALVGLVAFYAVGALVPRPMVALRLERHDELAIDFHSHTEASHDGRPGFSAEWNRAWHRGGGFAAAYVTDHSTWNGWNAGRAANPDSAGAGTMLLPGVEAVYRHGHAVALGSARRYETAVSGRDIEVDSLRALFNRGTKPPTLLLTLPAGLQQVAWTGPSDSLGYIGIELRDAAPRGIEQARRDRLELLGLADSLDLALVSGSNNHGWGWTAASWTVMRIPGWRHMDADTLEARIESLLHTRRHAATRVLTRWAPDTDGSPLRLAATLPALAWAMLTGLTPAERLSWLLWIWVPALLLWRRASPEPGRKQDRPPRP